ncbi:MAG TPA: hypothetical protein VK470_13590 [Bacteroidota bacterium]|nr:hypothetical protein [Bacteroidota bacterium]
MKKTIITAMLIVQSTLLLSKPVADADTTASAHSTYEVQKTFEAESLFPMFLTNGYHFCAAYRFNHFRVRISVINGGTYDAEPAGVSNAQGDFKRYYKPSPGVFFGYNVWKNLEVYTFLEGHTFQIEQKTTGMKQDMKSLDFGGGVSYQFFIGRVFYIQPGAHIYLRERKTLQFAGALYRIPGVDLAPVIRIGFRLWEKE